MRARVALLVFVVVLAAVAYWWDMWSPAPTEAESVAAEVTPSDASTHAPPAVSVRDGVPERAVDPAGTEGSDVRSWPPEYQRPRFEHTVRETFDALGSDREYEVECDQQPCLVLVWGPKPATPMRQEADDLRVELQTHFRDSQAVAVEHLVKVHGEYIKITAFTVMPSEVDFVTLLEPLEERARAWSDQALERGRFR